MGTHTSRLPPGNFFELGKCGCVYSHSPIPAGVLGTASHPAASTAGGASLGKWGEQGLLDLACSLVHVGLKSSTLDAGTSQVQRTEAAESLRGSALVYGLCLELRQVIPVRPCSLLPLSSWHLGLSAHPKLISGAIIGSCN